MKRWHNQKSINKMRQRKRELKHIGIRINVKLGEVYTRQKLGCGSSVCWCKDPFNESFKSRKDKITFKEQVNEL